MKKLEKIESEYSQKEIIYEYFGNPNDHILRAFCGITFPDVNYEVKRRTSSLYSIEYVIEGEGAIQDGDSIHKVCAGDMFILHPNRYHHYYSSQKNPWKKIWMIVADNLDYISTLLKLYKIENITLFRQINTDLYLYDIFDLFKSRESISGAELELYLYKFVSELSRISGDLSSNSDKLEAAKLFIDRQIAKRLYVDEVARYVNMNYSYFSTAFKKEYGISPSKYIKSKKMELAKSFLENTNMNIPAIAEQLAFFDASHFSHAFYEHYGMTATEYRKMYSEKTDK